MTKFTRDEAFPIADCPSGHPTKDERLLAIGPGRQALSWMVWTGAVEPVVTAAIEHIEAQLAAPGLTPGKTLAAEPGPVQAQMVGLTWTDSVMSAIGNALGSAVNESDP